MALARVKVWNPGDVLTAADLNAEFNNILNNPGTLISPLTANLNLGNFQLVSARLENVTTTQAAAQVGRAMFNTSDNMVNIDDGTAIRKVPTIVSSAMITGDLITASTAASPTWVRTSMGAVGSALAVTSSGNIPQWVNTGPITAAWATFNGTTATLFQSFNVSSITRNAAGDYSINWQTQMSSQNYFLQAMVAGSSGAATPNTAIMATSGNSTASGRIVVKNAAGTLVDVGFVSVIAYSL